MPALAWVLPSVVVDWSSIGLGGVLHALIFSLVCLHCLRSVREPRSTLLWIFIAWSLPFFGALLYVMLGSNRVSAKVWHKQRSDLSFLNARRRHDSDSYPFAYWRELRRASIDRPQDPGLMGINDVLDRLTPEHPLIDGNAVTSYVDGPEAYPPFFEACRSARQHIHLQSYIIGNDPVGRELMDVLVERAAAGVKVRVLYDQFGSAGARLTGFFLRYRRVPNLRVVGFTQVNPIKRQFQINLRNHRKILVVDGEVAFTGGMNLYWPHRPLDGRLPIRDYHFRVQGPIVHELQYTFLRDWYYMTDEDPANLLSRPHFPRIEPAGKTPLRIINGGPTGENEAQCDAFFSVIAAAREQILLVTPYFLPPEDQLRALRAAALRGVDVRLLLPQRGNHISVHYAARAVYDTVLSAGVRIFLRRPPFIHAKALIVDAQISIIGTANFDNRSLKLNYETNLVAFDTVFGSELKRIVLDDFAQADELDLAAWRRRPPGAILVENLFNLMSPSL